MIFFLVIIGILVFLFISTIQIEIRNLVINSTNKKENKKKLYIRLKILNKLTYLKFELNKEKITNFKVLDKRILKKINQIQKKLMSNRKEILNIDIIRVLTRLNIEIDELRLYLKIGLGDSFLTAITVGMIWTLVSILIAKNTKEHSNKYYSIMPEYNKNPFIKIKLKCIINIKMIHIINVIYILKKNKKRSEEYDERISNRRTYADVNE